MSSLHSDLLYKLRSPTTPLAVKLHLVQTTVSIPITNQLIRDFILDLFLRSIKGVVPTTAAVSGDEGSILFQVEWWKVLARVVGTALGSTTTTTLPIFIHFFSHYPPSSSASSAASVSSETTLLRAVGISWRKLLNGAMRKVNVDMVLESQASLLKASWKVLSSSSSGHAEETEKEEEREEEREEWEDVLEGWLKAFRVVVDGGKGGKKIPSHTLSTLPLILPLLSLLPPTSSLRQSILLTVQVCLFNFDNLRRGIARESYNAGAGSNTTTEESAEGELFNALKHCGAEESVSESDIHNALPLLFNLYRLSLDTHSAALFPLSAKSSFLTPSAARSAAEIHSLAKRRALACGWIRGVANLIHWSSSTPSEEGKVGTIECLWRTFEEVEKGDLYRAGDGWENTLDSIIAGAVIRLQRLAQSDEVERESLLGLLGTCMRLSYASVESYLPSILSSLASTASSASNSTTSTTTSAFLSALLVHHSRSLLLPALLLLLSTALASPSAVINNMLTTHSWNDELALALTGMVGITTGKCWEDLIDGMKSSIDSVDTTMVDGGVVVVVVGDDDVSRSKKRRKTAISVLVDAPIKNQALAARIRLFSLFVQSLPSPVPLGQFKTFHTTFVIPAMEVNSGHLGEVLAVRFRMIERMRLEGVSEIGFEVLELQRLKMVSLVKASMNGQLVIELSRTLLQSIASNAPDQAVVVLDAILSRLPNTNETKWSGHLQGIETVEIGTAIWELISRRWLSTFELFANDIQKRQLAQLITRSISAGEVDLSVISIDSITVRLLRRADFYELRSIQSQFHISLLEHITLPSLATAVEALALISSKKSVKTLTVASISTAIKTFDQIAALLPMEYLGKNLRNELVERALGLDLWITKSESEMDGEEKLEGLKKLRKFVGVAKSEGSILNGGAIVLGSLLDSTGSDTTLTSLTLRLFREYVESAILHYKSNPTDATVLISYIQSFDKPLSSLQKRSKSGIVEMTCRELAFFSLCEVVVAKLNQSTLLPTVLTSIATLLHSATKPFSKMLSAINVAESLASGRLTDVVNAVKSMWSLRDWSTATGTEEDETVLLYSNFMQSVLVQLVVPMASTTSISIYPAMLNLLSFRINRLRSISDSTKLSTLPFETFIACHISFRQALISHSGASLSLESNLRKAAAGSSHREYTIALDDVAAAVGNAVANDVASLRSILEVALILIRDGPEGSSRISSNCVAEILRHITFLVVRYTPSSAIASVAMESNHEALTGEELTKVYLVLAEFIEGVAADRPMLLSRQNVSTILSLVSQLLLPSSSSILESATPTPAPLASKLYLSLVSIVSHLVRHRKDHITPLFPHLVNALAGFINGLRRSGYGSLGSTVASIGTAGIIAIGGGGGVEEVGSNLGKRVEREARLSFPYWIWEGGAHGVAKGEAKLLGRLLSSLATKTTATTTSSTASTANGKEKTSTATGTKSTSSLSAPLSKHSPFIFLPYLHACVHPTSPILAGIRNELQGGWWEIMDVMGKWEREALMKGFLKEEEEGERGVLRGMWRGWEAGRYRG